MEIKGKKNQLPCKNELFQIRKITKLKNKSHIKRDKSKCKQTDSKLGEYRPKKIEIKDFNQRF